MMNYTLSDNFVAKLLCVLSSSYVQLLRDINHTSCQHAAPDATCICLQACAHLYTKSQGEKLYGLGQCISMNSELNGDNFFNPCDALDKRDLIYGFGLCQAGTSAAVGPVRVHSTRCESTADWPQSLTVATSLLIRRQRRRCCLLIEFRLLNHSYNSVCKITTMRVTS